MLYGLVLAGGRSTRMGSDKLALVLNGRTLLQSAVDLLLESGVDAVLISGQSDQTLSGPVTFIPDREIAQAGGPPRGLLSVLYWLKAEGRLLGDKLLVTTGDMPAQSVEMLSKLHREMDSAQAVRYSDEVFPFCLRLNEAVVNNAQQLLSETSSSQVPENHKQQISMKQLLKAWQAKILDKEGLTEIGFTNVNTPEQWQNLMQQLQQG